MIFDLQKASIWKRMSAFLFDIIILSVVTTGFLFFISTIVKTDRYTESIASVIKEYEDRYSVTIGLTEEETAMLTDEEKADYDKAYAALMADDRVSRAYESLITVTLFMVGLSIFLGTMLMEFVIPLFLKNGMTIGKKLFGLGVMTVDGVKMNNLVLAMRTILGKFTFELMIPALIITMILFGQLGTTGIVILVLIALLELIVMIATRTNSMIHDLVAGTVVIDFPSQMIFETKEEMIKYKEKQAEEKEKE
ncbi:MAG: RDD family protein [Lachnospiraceae bacterium]|nr:RDD family protein [Lachnospiraceae bacterium]MBP5249941.1 RDD family protein [Lachnospiraceae bacterium]